MTSLKTVSRKGAQMQVNWFYLFLTPLREKFFRFVPLLFRSAASRSVQGRNLLADDRILRSFVYINLGPMSVVLRHICIGKNCFHGTLRHARIAIDASIGIDVKTIW